MEGTEGGRGGVIMSRMAVVVSSIDPRIPTIPGREKGKGKRERKPLQLRERPQHVWRRRRHREGRGAGVLIFVACPVLQSLDHLATHPLETELCSYAQRCGG